MAEENSEMLSSKSMSVKTDRESINRRKHATHPAGVMFPDLIFNFLTVALFAKVENKRSAPSSLTFQPSKISSNIAEVGAKLFNNPRQHANGGMKSLKLISRHVKVAFMANELPRVVALSFTQQV